MQCLQGSGPWAVLLLHKRYRYLKTRSTYTRTHCKLKITPSTALTRLSRSHSCMHDLNAAILRGERKSQRTWQFNSSPHIQHRQEEEVASWLVQLPPDICGSFLCYCYIAASSRRNTLPFAERVLQQPAPILIGIDLERTLGIWRLERICFLNIAGTANTAFQVL